MEFLRNHTKSEDVSVGGHRFLGWVYFGPQTAGFSELSLLLNTAAC